MVSQNVERIADYCWECHMYNGRVQKNPSLSVLSDEARGSALKIARNLKTKYKNKKDDFNLSDVEAILKACGSCDRKKARMYEYIEERRYHPRNPTTCELG